MVFSKSYPSHDVEIILEAPKAIRSTPPKYRWDFELRYRGRGMVKDHYVEVLSNPESRLTADRVEKVADQIFESFKNRNFAMPHKEVLQFNNYVPDFVKEFERLTVEVQYRGVFLDDEADVVNHVWAYRIKQPGLLTVPGLYKWSTEKRELTLENVANHVGSFFKNTENDVPEATPVKEDRPEMLAGGGFIAKAISAVQICYYSREPNLLDRKDIYVVWFCKTLQNWKALVSTNAKDDRYYEVTYNGDKKEMYIDAYSKVDQYVLNDIHFEEFNI